ncbi:hypothetical protein ACWGBU_40355, partial [Streptomyces vinaceus]
MSLQRILEKVALALRGQAGQRLSERLAYPVSGSTLLRLIRRLDLPAVGDVVVLGGASMSFVKASGSGLGWFRGSGVMRRVRRPS